MATKQTQHTRRDSNKKLPRSGNTAQVRASHLRTAERPNNMNLYPAEGYTPIGKAVLAGNVEQIRCLLAQGVNIYAPVHRVHRTITLLRLAEMLDRVEVVERLCQLGFDPSAKQADGSTELHSLMGFSPQINRLIVAAAHDLEARNELGLTALQYAAWCNREAVVRALLDGGANIEARDERGCTVLMYAASRGNSEMVSYLLARQADVNARDKNGKTALYYAIRFGVPDAARVLVQAGATPDEHTVNCKDYLLD